MPNTTSNEPQIYNPSNELLDTGANNVKPVDGNWVESALTVSQNASTDKFYDNMKSLLQNDNPWIKSNEYQLPYNTRLKDTIRYDDPEFGFDPFNANLEYQYGDRQGALTKWKNNFIKFGANTVGSFVEGMAMVPILTSAIANGDMNKIENNKLTNGVTDFLDSLENSLPNYETSFGRDHPVLNYVPFLGNTGDTWGGVLKNLGYTVGAIGSAVVTDLGVGALTSGIGAAPLVGVQLTNAAGKLGKIFGAGTSTVESFTKLLQGGSTIEEALNTMSKSAKILDNVRFGISLTTSALSESMIEANQVHKNLDADLRKAFFDANGYDAQGADLELLTKYSKEGANGALLANFGLLLLTESAMFSSLLKPSSAARRALAETANEGVSVKLADKSLDLWEGIKPSKGFKGILQRVGKSDAFRSMGIEGGQEGGQYVIEVASENYYKHKFEKPSIDGVNNFVSSVGEGFHDVINTREGVENIVLGALTGAIISPTRRLIERRMGISPDPKDRMTYVLETLNSNPLTGVFTDKYNSAVTAYTLSNKMAEAKDKEDEFGYQNLKHQQLFNFVSAGMKTNRFESQIYRLESIKDLNENDMRAILNITDPNVSKEQLDQHVNNTIKKAMDIKKDIEKIDLSFPNRYNRSTQRDEYYIFEDYKDKLAVSLSEIRDNKSRVRSLTESIKDVSQSILDTNKVVNLTNTEGIDITIKEFSERIKAIEVEDALLTDPAFRDSRAKIRKEKKFLEQMVSDLQNKQENPQEYIATIRSIYNYYANSNSLEGNANMDILDTVLAHNQAFDIFRLSRNIDAANDYFSKLLDKKNFDKTIADVREFRRLLAEAQQEEQARAAEVAATVTPANQGDDVVPTEGNEEIDEEGNVINAAEATAEEVVTEEENDLPFDPDIVDAEIAGKKGKKPTKKEEKDKTDIQAQIAELRLINEQEKDSIKQQLLGLGQSEENAEEAAVKGAKTTPSGKKIAALEKKLKDDGTTPEPKTPKTPSVPKVTVPKVTIDPVEQSEPVETGDKPTSPIKTNVQEGKKGDRKYAFNPMNFFNKVFSKSFKNDGAEIKAKRDLLLSKTAAEIGATATIKVVESTSGMKFGDYREMDGTNGKIFFTGYQYDMSLEFEGLSIGLIQPANRLFFKRGEEYVPLYDIKLEEYVDVTGNSIDTYQDFIDETSAYKAITEKVITEFKGGKTEFSNADLRGMFSFVLNYGTPRYTNNAAEAVLLKNVTYDKPGNVVLSLPMEINEDGVFERASPTVLGNGLTAEQNGKLQKFIVDNIDRIKGFNSRYIFIAQLPNGEYGKNSIIAARAGEASAENLDKLVSMLKENPTTNEEAKLLNSQIREEFFIADSTSKKGQGANLFLSVGVNGKIYLNILNKNVIYRTGGVEKVGYNRRIEIPKAKSAADINSLVEAINGSLYLQKSRDSALNKMNIVVSKSDFKSGILKDESVSFDQLKNSLSIAVLPTNIVTGTTSIFEDPQLYVVPNNQKSNAAKTTPVTPKPTTPTTPAAPVVTPTPTETKTSTASAASFLKDKEAKASARNEAKAQSNEEVNNEFLNSLGC